VRVPGIAGAPGKEDEVESEAEEESGGAVVSTEGDPAESLQPLAVATRAKMAIETNPAVDVLTKRFSS
jgi:hypothetical protein